MTEPVVVGEEVVAGAGVEFRAGEVASCALATVEIAVQRLVVIKILSKTTLNDIDDSPDTLHA